MKPGRWWQRAYATKVFQAGKGGRESKTCTVSVFDLNYVAGSFGFGSWEISNDNASASVPVPVRAICVPNRVRLKRLSVCLTF